MPTTKNTSCRPASAAPFQPLLRAAGALGVLLIGAGLLTHSAQTAEGIRDGLASCAALVIPSLLPFLIFSGVLSTTRLGDWVSRPLEPVCRWVFHLPPEAGSALLMSMIGGYPVGARTIAQLLEQGRIQPRTARRMLCFCINAGPAFVVSTVGAALYSSVQAGLCLLAAHLGASAIVGFFICTGKETFEPAPPAEPLPLGTAFVQSVSGAAQSLIGICAFVVTFSGLRSLLWETGLLPRLVTALERLWPVSGGSAFYTALLRGLLEVTDGCIAASALGGEQAFVLTAFLLSFGGVSVICQAAAAFRRLPMSFGLLFFSRFAGGCIAAALASLLYQRCLADLLAGMQYTQPVAQATVAGIIGGLSLIGMGSILLLSMAMNGISTKKRFSTGKTVGEMI